MVRIQGRTHVAVVNGPAPPMAMQIVFVFGGQPAVDSYRTIALDIYHSGLVIVQLPGSGLGGV